MEREERGRWSTANRRDDVVMRMLKKGGPISVPELIKRARHSPMFKQKLEVVRELCIASLSGWSGSVSSRSRCERVFVGR